MARERVVGHPLVLAACLSREVVARSTLALVLPHNPLDDRLKYCKRGGHRCEPDDIVCEECGCPEFGG